MMSRSQSRSGGQDTLRSRSASSRPQLFAQQDAVNIHDAERAASRDTRGTLQSQARRDRYSDEGDSFDKVADISAHRPNRHILSPVKRPLTNLGKFFQWIHNFSILTRWFLYITPVTLILLVPLLVGALYEPQPSIAGVYLQWFAIWWEIIWLTLWAAKLAAKLVPWIFGPICSIFTNSYKKWRDLCRAIEIPLTLFAWWLAIYISFLPIMEHHQTPNFGTQRQGWQTTLNRIILTIFIAMCLNLIEKVFMQLVAIGFHQRQYEDRIVLNKFQIAALTKLYRYSRETARLKIDNDEADAIDTPNGARTPTQTLANVGKVMKKTARDAVGKVADEIAGRRAIEISTSPRQVVLTLLDTTVGAQTLARRLFASYKDKEAPETDYLRRSDMREAFTDDEEADAAFAMFDKDFNGDVTCEEMEIACVEIAKERKSITSSLKDLDHAVEKLDDICTTVVVVISILIFIVLISRSFSGVLTSAGTTILGLSWLFSQLAQEFLASIVFVFVKHPFDVGDRVDVMMNGTVQSLIVKEISLMATEFRLLDGRIVQAPNNVLNQLFILNMRRTGGVAEGVPTTLRFGVSIEQIDQLRQSMVEFVRSEPRDYKPDILSELTDIPNLTAVKFTLIFFHKQNWQNEGLRIGRRNKFMCALMVNIQRLGMQSSVFSGPGAAADTPMYWRNLAATQDAVSNGIQALSSERSQGQTRPSVGLTTLRDDTLAKNTSETQEWPDNDTKADRGEADKNGPVQWTQDRRSQQDDEQLHDIARHRQEVDYSLGATEFAQSNTNEFFEESQQRSLQSVMEVAEHYEERVRAQQHAEHQQERRSMSRLRSPSGPPRFNIMRSNTNMSSNSIRMNRFGRARGVTMHRSQRLADEENSIDNVERISTTISRSQVPDASLEHPFHAQNHIPDRDMIHRDNMAPIAETQESSRAASRSNSVNRSPIV